MNWNYLYPSYLYHLYFGDQCLIHKIKIYDSELGLGYSQKNLTCFQVRAYVNSNITNIVVKMLQHHDNIASSQLSYVDRNTS